VTSLKFVHLALRSKRLDNPALYLILGSYGTTEQKQKYEFSTFNFNISPSPPLLGLPHNQLGGWGVLKASPTSPAGWSKKARTSTTFRSNLWQKEHVSRSVVQYITNGIHTHESLLTEKNGSCSKLAAERLTYVYVL